MSTLSPTRPDRPDRPNRPGSAGARTRSRRSAVTHGLTERRPGWLRPAAPESEADRAARRRLRRRLVIWSLPVIVLMLLVALKLFATVALGEDALRSYTQGNITGTQDAADRLQVVNVIEPHKAPFALGDARVMTGDFDGARGAFEQALALAPKDSVESCQIRVNLVLSLEKLGTAATSAGRPAQAEGYADRLSEVVTQAPHGCFQGDAQDNEGQQLRDAQQWSQEQQQQAQQQQQDQQQPQDQPSPPSEDKQQQLDTMTQDNLQQRQETDGQRGSGGSSVAKPW